MNEGDWEVIFESPRLHECRERLLVLQAVGIPGEIVNTLTRHALVVPSSLAERAKFEIWQYDKENVAAPVSGPRFEAIYQDSVPGIVMYVAVICVVAWLAGRGAFGYDWLGAGRVDGVLIRQGEWWRTLTALTLHGSLKHLMGNIGFGILFGFLAGRVTGSGVAWLGIVMASGVANAINTVLLESTHRSIGASTAVFAALGLVAGFVWRGRLTAQDRWAYRLGPVVGGIALLAYTGTGDENTDIGAHLLGFVCGFAAGMLLTHGAAWLSNRAVQVLSGAAALSLIVIAWIVALDHWA